MNPPTAAPRALRVLAVALGIANVALVVAWLRLEPPLAPSAPPSATAHEDATQEPATARGDASAPREADPVATRTDEPTSAAATTAVLFGTVKRASGALVDDGFLWLQRDGKQVGLANLGIRTARGVFAIAGLQPGAHRLTTRIADELAVDREVVVQAPQTRLDLELPAKWLLTVNATTADGKPLTEAVPALAGPGQRNLRALAFAEPLAGDLVSSRSSEFEAGLGPFRSNDPFFGRDRGKALPKETLGVLTLPAGQPVHVALLLGTTLIAQQPANPGQEKVEFVLTADAVTGKTGTVSFRCVDPDGAPVVGASVSVGSGSGRSFGDKALTDADGRYTAKDVIPGRVDFGVWHKELRMPPVVTDLAAGASVDLGTFTMRAAIDVEISFAGSGGGGSVTSYWLDVPREATWRSTEQYSNEQNGPTAKLSLYPGRHSLIARGKSGVALLELDTNALPSQPLRIPWGPAASLRIDSHAVATFLQFEIANARGLIAYRGETGNRTGYSLPLPPGEYVVSMRASGGSVTKKNVTLPASGAVLTLP